MPRPMGQVGPNQMIEMITDDVEDDKEAQHLAERINLDLVELGAGEQWSSIRDLKVAELPVDWDKISRAIRKQQIGNAQ